MKAIFRFVFILFTDCLFYTSISATVSDDSLMPPHTWIKDYQIQKDYQYKTEIHNPTKGLEILLQWLKDIIDRLFYSHPAQIFWKYFMYIAAIAIILVIIWYFNKFGTGALRKRNPRKIETGILSDDIHELDFEALISEAEKTAQYRLAMRWQYLKYLKHLDDIGVIHWQQNKTNTDYKFEIIDPAGQYKFSRIARGFEDVWYGEAPADYAAYMAYIDMITTPLTAPVV